MERPLTAGQLAHATGVPAKPFATTSRSACYRCHGGVAPGIGTLPPRCPSALFIRRARALGLSLAKLKELTAELDSGSV